MLQDQTEVSDAPTAAIDADCQRQSVESIASVDRRKIKTQAFLARELLHIILQ